MNSCGYFYFVCMCVSRAGQYQIIMIIMIVNILIIDIIVISAELTVTALQSLNYVKYFINVTKFVLVMHRYEILPIFRLTNIAFPILADTDSRSDINITSKSANNRHHYAMKLLLNIFKHHP